MDSNVRIDLLLPPKSQYGVLAYFTEHLGEALKREGAKVRILKSNKEDPATFLDTIYKDPPKITLSFNGILPSEKGIFLADLLKIPHLAYLVDTPGEYISLINSKRTFIACVDRNFTSFFHSIGAKTATFLPHAIDLKVKVNPLTDRKYDLVMLGSCIDYPLLQAYWTKEMKPPIAKALNEAAEEILSTPTSWSGGALLDALERQHQKGANVDLPNLNFPTLFYLLEQYVKGKEKIDLLSHIEDVKIDVFGSGEWKKLLKSKKAKIAFHEEVPFDQAIAIMQQSKVVLHSCPTIKNGSHERVLTAISQGALPIMGSNLYLQEQFPEWSVFFHYGKWDKLNETIQEYLGNDAKRSQRVLKMAEIVKKRHTFDVRAKEILQLIPKLLKTL